MTRGAIFSGSDFHTAHDALMAGRDKAQRTIATHTRLARRGPHDIAVQYHATDVVTYHQDGTVTLNTGGYETVTTKRRINDYTPRGLSVFARNFAWFVVIDYDWSDPVPFVDGMTFDPATRKLDVPVAA
jgi:hypothetical protein